MSIEKWHGGKIVMLWVVGAVVAFIGAAVVAAFVQASGAAPSQADLAGLLFAVVVFVVCTSFTWSWFSAREK